MYSILFCLTQQHSPSLLVLAGLICLSSNAVGLVLLQRSRHAPERKWFWLAAAGFTTGFGIWGTHFVAMLAYDPGFGVRYEMGWTLGSLVIGTAFTLPALVLARLDHGALWSIASGTLFGLGIAGTHNLGMLGVVIPGTFEWNVGAVILSDVLGCVFAALAFEALRRDAFRHGKLVAASLLFTAIFVLHFIGIGTAVAVPGPMASNEALTLPREGLAAAIAGLALAVLSLGLAAVWLDAQMVAAAAEVARMRQLADASLEGIAIVRGSIITDVNRSLLALIKRTPGEVIGRPFSALLADGEIIRPGAAEETGATQARLLRHDGTALPVELHRHTMSFADGPRDVIAIRDLRERAEAEAHIRFLAHHDPLTGLLNRSSLQSRLLAEIEAARALEGRFAVLCLDLDRFKEVNDTYGHPAGDELLRLVANRLRSLLRTSDAVYRNGGDEFVVVQAGVADASAVEVLSRRVIEALSAPYAIGGRYLTIGVSIGISLFPQDGSDPVELLKSADIALYRAKADGRGRAVPFNHSLAAELRRRRLIEADLREAINRDELALVYQEQVDPRTGQPIGYEALLRWRSPRVGSIAPATFIPIAEESGLIIPMGEWVLRTACREAMAWSDRLGVSVNLSPVQLQDPGLPQLITLILVETGLNPSRLELEVTETALIRDRERTLDNLKQLKQLGLRIALDDFGTGYSSLSYLQTFPLDTLKIDRCFVTRSWRTLHQPRSSRR